VRNHVKKFAWYLRVVRWTNRSWRTNRLRHTRKWILMEIGHAPARELSASTENEPRSVTRRNFGCHKTSKPRGRPIYLASEYKTVVVSDAWKSMRSILLSFYDCVRSTLWIFVWKQKSVSGIGTANLDTLLRHDVHCYNIKNN